VSTGDLASTLDGSAGELGEYGMQSFWATTEQYTTEHGDVVDGFSTAMNKAAGWLADDANKDAAVQSIMGVTQLPKEAATEIWELQHKEFVPEIDEDRWNSNVDWTLGDGGAAKVPFATFVISDCG
jgi:NitT/TauT family transport system substrate-binding protein